MLPRLDLHHLRGGGLGLVRGVFGLVECVTFLAGVSSESVQVGRKCKLQAPFTGEPCSVPTLPPTLPPHTTLTSTAAVDLLCLSSCLSALHFLGLRSLGRLGARPSSDWEVRGGLGLGWFWFVSVGQETVL